MFARLAFLLVPTLGLIASTCVAAPTNDNWTNREVISSLPYSSTIADIQLATIEPTDPPIYCVYSGYLGQQPDSVWYEFSTGENDAYVTLSATGYDSLISVYEGNPTDGFRMVTGACNDDDSRTTSFAAIRGLRLHSGGTYSILVSHYVVGASSTATLNFSLLQSPVRQVTKVADSDDNVCDADCSLREAITTNTQGVHGAILIPAGHYMVANGVSFSASSETYKGVSMYGAGMDKTIIDANFSGPVLRSESQSGLNAPNVLLSNLSLVNGVSSTNGGALESAQGYLVLDHVAVRNNTASGDGGGIYVISHPGGTSSIVDSEFTGNKTLNGVAGGIFVSNDRGDISNSLFSNNEALGSASANGCGAAIARAIEMVQITNTTFSGNRTNGLAAALCAGMRGNDSSFALRNLTIVNNRYDTGGVGGVGAGLYVEQSNSSAARPISLINSVLAGNRGGISSDSMGDCAKVGLVDFNSGYDLAEVPGNCSFAAVGDIVGLQPMLLPLAPVNSVHPVHVPAIGSPLIDQADPGTSCAAQDSRGVIRPQDGDGDTIARCDIGAVERQIADEFIFSDGFE